MDKQRVPNGYELIDAEVYINKTKNEIVVVGSPDEDDETHNCDEMGCSSVSHVIFRSKFVPDPTPSPTIRPGTIVTHKDKRMKHLRKGLVREISASGKSAYVKWESGWLSRYSLDKLEVIESD